jgi:AcrR family transcriptional regulator
MSPKVDMADERRAHIMQAALACFARKGYHLTTMDDIAQESGLSKGSLYWYFESKKELFLSIFEAYFRQMETAVRPILEGTLSPSEKLHAIAEMLVDLMAEAQSFVGVMIDFWSQTRHEEDINQLLRQIYEPYYQGLVAIIEEGIQQGEFRPVNAAHLASLLIAVYDGLMMQWLAMPEWVDLAGQTQTLLNVLLGGLKPR